MITVATSAILGTLAFIKVKEKRSYKSFITEKYIRMSGMKKRLKMKRTRKALEETKEITAGKYGGTSYEFKHDVRTKSWNGCVTYIVNDQRNHQQKLFYIFMVVHGSKIH